MPEPTPTTQELRQRWEAAIAERQEATVYAVGAYTQWQRARARQIEAERRERLAFLELTHTL